MALSTRLSGEGSSRDRDRRAIASPSDTVAVQASVRGGALDRDAADRADRIFDLPRFHADPPLGAGHATDGFFHQRAAEVVRATLEDDLTRLDTELHPRHLDVPDRAVEEDPGHRVHPSVVLEGRPGAGSAGEVDRGVLVDEGERNELGEAARLALDPSKATDVENPVWRGIDMAEHDRGGGPDPERVSGLDDLLPLVGRQLALREEPPDVVVQDLGACPGHRAEPARPAFGEELAERDPHLPPP